MKRQHLYTLMVLIGLSIVVFALSLYDIFNDQGWTIMILALYGVLFVPLINIVLTTRLESSSHPTKAISPAEKQFRCPSCHQTFSVAIPATRPVSFTHVCSKCGYLGTISLGTKP